MIMEKCKGKEPYYTHAEAEAACTSLKRSARKTGKGGRSFHRLIVYACGNHFHIGRDCTQHIQKMAEIVHTTSAKKIPSYGELMRKLKRIEAKIDGAQKHRAFVLGQIIESDRRREYQEALAAIGYPENSGG
ncbi:MAG TPA: hypothetical protein VE377_09165 [Candidatus Dormibacteraeota bacterium]|nr:hypothetical protein [Candidatus Dormibacteraeota bacterium]